MLQHLKGESVPKDNIDPGCKIFTMDNIDELEQ